MTDAEHPDAPTSLPASELEGASDADLILLVRAGDSAAYEQLFIRHRDVAIRYARRLSDSERAEDLCAEAFTKILDLLQRGKGPDVAFRAYLLTTVRTSHLNTIRAGIREDLVPDHEPIARMTPTIEDPDARFDASAIYRAFDKLPERWQAALWLTSVEGLTNEEASQHLGVRVNAVASLAFRARAGLRQAYLNEHLLETTDPQCRRIVELLPNYLRHALSARRRATVETHLSTCVSCTTAALELTEVNVRLGAVLAPLALAGAIGGVAVAPAKAASLVALGGAAASSVKGTVYGALLQAKATGSTLIGALGTKAAVAATVTAIGVAVSAEIVEHHDSPSAGPSARSTAPSDPPSVLAAPRRSAAPDPTPATQRSTDLVEPPSASRRVTHPTGSPSASPTTKAPLATAPTPTSSPSEAYQPARLSVEQPTARTYLRNGLRWERISVPVTNPVEDSFLTITVSRTLEAALATTTGTGWVCGTPVTSWFDGGLYATSTISCMFDANEGDGPPLFDYRVADGSVLTAELTPPADVQDADRSDNVRQLQLR